MEPKDDKPRTDAAASGEPAPGKAQGEAGADRVKPVEAEVAEAKPLRLEKPTTTRWKIGPATTGPATTGPAKSNPAKTGPIDQRKFAQMSRRELLKISPVLALGAFAIPRFQESLLKKGLGFSDWASARLFRQGHLAPTFSDTELTPFEKFPINGYDVADPGVIFESWTLTVTGLVRKPGDYKLEQIQALQPYRQNTRHICVEGWDVIGRFGGARLSDFLNMIGADTKARFITVACADDYYESLDMATALHPQTLLCYEMYDRPLTREHGAPLRLNVPTKVGYKQPKYLTDLKVTNVLDKVGYWEDQGYSSFYGL
jgi:DMSO/TMAO reductase YedYZ molybdopterin-dependent catalytic subunit